MWPSCCATSRVSLRTGQPSQRQAPCRSSCASSNAAPRSRWAWPRRLWHSLHSTRTSRAHWPRRSSSSCLARTMSLCASEHPRPSQAWPPTTSTRRPRKRRSRVRATASRLWLTCSRTGSRTDAWRRRSTRCARCWPSRTTQPKRPSSRQVASCHSSRPSGRESSRPSRRSTQPPSSLASRHSAATPSPSTAPVAGRP